ncbi:hypothetical protein AHAS_Ahas19G0269200 [Arachis hypogaea]
MSDDKKAIVEELEFAAIRHIPALNVSHKLLKKLAYSFDLYNNTLDTRKESKKRKRVIVDSSSESETESNDEFHFASLKPQEDIENVVVSAMCQILNKKKIKRFEEQIYYVPSDMVVSSTTIKLYPQFRCILKIYSMLKVIISVQNHMLMKYKH